MHVILVSPIDCRSVNEVVCHGIPDSRKLRSGDIVNLDITVYYKGYAENETKNITTGRFPKIVACTLHNDAGVIGAAALENSI